ncbi:MAG: MipA/OmpV family protein [Gammaproteobacteria bacterium]|nr:MipA/OmpV family protein [Gammaproteobacteria bacterium]
MSRFHAYLSNLRTIVVSLLWLHSAPGMAATLSVSLDNPPEVGFIELQLYDSANAFVAQLNPVQQLRYPLNERASYLFAGLAAGEYALRVYHDANSNGRMDKNFIGIPIEAIGFSNRYQPKAPPNYRQAAFTIAENQQLNIDVELYQPLGKRGQLGVGVGIIARSSPYRDYEGGVSQGIPAITYIGERLQVYGPLIQYGLVGSGKLRLALSGQYRIGVYEEADSPLLAGMGDRENTFLAGLAIEAELPGDIDVALGYQHDVLDRIGGGVGSLSISKSFQSGIVQYTPQLSLNYLSPDITRYDFGVAEDVATLARPAYHPDSSTSVEVGIRFFSELSREWLLQASINLERFGDEVTDSPIVDEDEVIKGFITIGYVF